MSERASLLGKSEQTPTREELLRFVAEATEYAGSFAHQMGGTMPWTPARKARSHSVYAAGRELLRAAGVDDA